MKLHGVHARLPLTLLIAALIGIVAIGSLSAVRQGASRSQSVRAGDVGWNGLRIPGF